MSDNPKRLRYDPRTGPDRAAWLGAPEAERTLAVRDWLKNNDLPFACCVPRSADEWREVEDQIASGTPPETTRLMERLQGAGVERLVALWAVAEALGSQQYKQLERMARDGHDTAHFDVGRLFEACDTSILPAAFEASAGGFGPSHEKVIDYYHRHYDPEGSLPFAPAAGFCFGCATAPKFVRNHTLYEHMYGNEIADKTPVYLPVADAYRELFRYVSDAVFEQDVPIPPSVRPPDDPQTCFDSSFSDWCKGFIATRPVVASGWEAHLAEHPRLHAEYLAIVDSLSFFAARDQAQAISRTRFGQESFESACRRVHAGLNDSIQRLFLLAHPIMDSTENP
ncbi:MULTISPECIES: hypothetical protein [unclassified Wenzhouxiangella]|uniref:hypothetical protein n=1 Tax=unclassified Wenzhouxiangella TaxID=2613841 RepID=UPI000E3258A3|nr:MULTISPECIES: hypothetical protein [unclassified Wenzhouxiangella]RFF27049.1 hypothetical protein DZK25_09880 [Wenzhouxiangella sp. 15181]RFP69412.1 hypothetical protein DZK26_04055 [Wenzhouxiangella sp. 15190]